MLTSSIARPRPVSRPLLSDGKIIGISLRQNYPPLEHSDIISLQFNLAALAVQQSRLYRDYQTAGRTVKPIGSNEFFQNISQ